LHEASPAWGTSRLLCTIAVRAWLDVISIFLFLFVNWKLAQMLQLVA